MANVMQQQQNHHQQHQHRQLERPAAIAGAVQLWRVGRYGLEGRRRIVADAVAACDGGVCHGWKVVRPWPSCRRALGVPFHSFLS